MSKPACLLRASGGNRCISARCNPDPLIHLLWLVCDQSAATVTIIDSRGLTAAISASAVNPQADTRMWRKCLVLRSESALGKPLIILVNGSADGSPGCLFQQWVGSKTNGFNVDSRMQEAVEQTEGKKKKKKEKKRSTGGELERGERLSAPARFMLSVDGRAFGIWNYCFFICKPSFGLHDCGPQTNPFGKRVLRLLILSIKVKRRARIFVAAHKGATQLFKWIPVLLLSVQALTTMSGSSKFAIRAGRCYPATVLHTSASCRNAEILLAHLKRCRCDSVYVERR